MADSSHREPNEAISTVITAKTVITANHNLPQSPMNAESHEFASVDSTSVSMTRTSSFEVPIPDTPEEKSDSDLPKKILDRYEFRSLLGCGGFGAVYEAWDDQLERSVAIKVARRDRFAGTTGRQRFLDEARAAAKLKHPHIVTVFDSGSDAEGNPFVVFELIAGESLADRIKRQPLPRADAVRIVVDVSEAIHAAHKLGLIHRDLKPGNILIDTAGQSHVTDFGLAVDERSQREQAGEIAGSPQYMSPEQIRGETQYLDGRTDVWSLGIILYELLGHRRPFTGRTLDEVRDEILNREPKPLRQLDESISRELEAVCLNCLRKNIADRWSSAADVAEHLRRATSAPAPQASRMFVVSLGALAIAFVIGIFFAARSWLDPAAGLKPQAVEPADASPAVTAAAPTPAAKPSAPTPGKWFPLLSRAPEYLLWPSDERNSKREYIQESRELWLTCGESGLVTLGDAKSDYDLQLQLHQSPWTGDVGVFFGLRAESREDSTFRKYQMIELACPRDRKGEYVFLKRVSISRQGKLVVNRETIATAQLPKLSNQAATLRFSVSGHRLSSVEWNGTPISQLTDPALESNPNSTVSQGPFGIVVDRSSVVVRHAEFLIPAEPHP